MDNLMKLKEYVKEGKDYKAKEFAKKLQGEYSPVKIFNALTSAMRELGERFDKKEIFIPELLIAADALNNVVEVIEPLLKEDNYNRRKTIVMGTVEGDLHEIGKNIVVIVLKAEGHNVVDLGTNVSIKTFIEESVNHKADVIGLSSLMTPTMINQKKVIDQLIQKKLRGNFKVIVGGAPINNTWAKEIGADAYCKDAFEGARYVKSLTIS